MDIDTLDINLITAFDSKTLGIGSKGSIPWKSPTDMAFFKKMTTDTVVVMGRITWESLNCKKLPNRINIVLSRDVQMSGPNYVAHNMYEIYNILIKHQDKKIFIIGGTALYEMFMPFAKYIYASHIHNKEKYEYDTFFPVTHFSKFYIADFERCNDSLDIITYKNGTGIIKEEQESQYLDLMKSIIDTDNIRPDRTNTGIASVFGTRLEFDISNSLPLLTTKFVGWKSILKELLFFMKGQTNTKILENQGVNIWRSNTTREFLDNRGLTNYEVSDMGPMYGWIWRHIGAEYSGCKADYTDKGVDQLANLVKGLKEDPYSRRHLITTFCPVYTDQGVLPPCHGICTQFYVENDGSLSCQVYLRSNDVFLGQPYNIASYAMFTYIIAKKVGMKPKRLIMTIGDCHVYANHFEQAKLQLQRPALPFPQFVVKDDVESKSFDDLNINDFDVVGYISHPTIKAPMAV
jgi:dihydrofolate reductase/thymidylate synthase